MVFSFKPYCFLKTLCIKSIIDRKAHLNNPEFKEISKELGWGYLEVLTVLRR